MRKGRGCGESVETATCIIFGEQMLLESQNAALVAVVRPGLHAPESLLETTITLGDSVSFGRVSNWVRDPGVFRDTIGEDLSNLVRAASFGFEIRFNVPPDQQTLTSSPGPSERQAERSLRNAALAFWLARPVEMFIPFLIRGEARCGQLHWRGARSTDAWIRRGFSRAQSGLTLSMSDAAEAVRISEAIARVTRPGSIAIAIDALWTAITTRSEAVAFLLYWVALEALFGTEKTERVTAAIVRRLHGFAVEELNQPVLSKREVSKYYRHRSAIVHGRGFVPKDRDAAEELGRVASSVEQLLRKAMIQIVKDDALSSALNSTDREAYLERRYPLDEGLGDTGEEPAAG